MMPSRKKLGPDIRHGQSAKNGIARLLVITTISTSLLGCASQEAKDRWLAAGAIAVVALAAYGAAQGGAGTANGLAPATDYDWDWDQFYHNGSLLWACRGIQTGQFAEQSRCQYKHQSDYRWPAK